MGGTQSQEEIPPSERRIYQNPQKIEKLAKILSVKSEQQKAVSCIEDWNQHEQDKQSVGMLRNLFKRLDPAILKSSEVSGQVQLSVKYDFKRELFLIKVIKCRDLQSYAVRSKSCDSYVKVELYPDTHGQGARTTKIVAESNSPVFSEIFSFSLTELELIDSKLVVQLWNYDVVTHDDFMGETIINMSSFNFKEEPVHTAWYTLRMETDLTITGELEVSVAYQIPQSLLVTIHGATGLSPRQDNTTANPFVKLTIPGVPGLYKSQVEKDTLEPMWEETFEFTLPQEELEFRYVIFHLIDASEDYENLSLGQAILDLDMISPDQGYHGTLQLSDLKNNDRLRGKLSQQVMAQEFREAFRAHLASRHPDFLFQRQMGKKMVTVSCRKAGARAQLRLVDGIPVS